MDKDQIEAIKARLRRVTVGFKAWTYRPYGNQFSVVAQASMTSQIEHEIALVTYERDVALITHAPEDITALVNEVDRLTANYDALVTEGLQSAAKYEQLIADLQAERDALEAEASVYRITVLGVNVAAGQGED